jgi:hypothetical protein
MTATPLHLAIMQRDDVDLQDAERFVQKMKEQVDEGGDPEEILFENGFEPDYVFDLI